MSQLLLIGINIHEQTIKQSSERTRLIPAGLASLEVENLRRWKRMDRFLVEMRLKYFAEYGVLLQIAHVDPANGWRQSEGWSQMV